MVVEYREFYSTLLIGLFVMMSCSDGSNTAIKTSINNDNSEFIWPVNPDFPYNLEKPTMEMKMSMVLKEISGLTYIPERKEIGAINDELGNIYFIDAESGKVKDKLRFGRFGDFEAIEYVDGLFYICNSKGAILVITPGQEVTTELRQTRLDYHNNVEGMGYDAAQNNLVLACKDQAQLKGEEKIKGKAFYSYSLDSKVLSREPSFVVQDKDLIKWFKENVGKMNKKITERVSSFSPSGVAIHPITRYIYTVSAKGDLLVVFNQDGKVLHVELVRDYIEQIEGICFDSEGTLYVSSEGVSKRGRVFAYSPID